MRAPLISVVVPAYLQAEFLPATVRSVLEQRYDNFELIVVSDASPDETDAAIAGFADPRLRYIVHEHNQGLSATRNTGIEASRGELIAFLDADDLFHPQKLAAHAEFLEKRPDVGASYNARFDLNHSSETTLEKWLPPLEVDLEDLLLGFPFSPSDLLVRREWMQRVGGFDPAVRTAEDTDLPCRLALQGCRFAGLGKALNSRRHHRGRPRRNLAGRLEDVRQVQATVFADPRCPDRVRALGPRAIKRHLMDVAALALIQSETELARTFLRELVDLFPAIAQGDPSELSNFLFDRATRDDQADHEALLRQMGEQLPSEYSALRRQLEASISRGYLWKGARALVWNPSGNGHEFLSQAGTLGVPLDGKFVQSVCSQLALYRGEYGDAATQAVIERLRRIWKSSGLSGFGRFEGSYFINRAFELYHAGQRQGVPHKVLRACWRDPSLAMNRGAMSIFLRSLLKPAAI